MRRYLSVILILQSLFIAACASLKNDGNTIQRTGLIPDGMYDSEYPSSSVSDDIEKIGASVKLLNCVAFYKEYKFKYEHQIRVRDISKALLEKYSSTRINVDRSAAGTATVIYNNNGYVALLTCAHVVSLPDTVFTYFIDADGIRSRYLQSISIKEKQTNYIVDFPRNGEVEVLARDNALDVALVGGKYELESTTRILSFGYAWGKAKELKWGDFVYCLGFPLNQKILTSGVVSSPNHDRAGSFYIDANFNRGFSGGVVLAIRDGVPNFEFVGMLKSVPADYDDILVPEKLPENGYEYGASNRYEGDIYIKRQRFIHYGITKAVPVEAIEEFIRLNAEDLKEKGYNFIY